MIAAALVRRRSRCGRRLAAPRRLKGDPQATRGSTAARESIDKSQNQQAAAKETTATSPPMMVVTAAGLPVLSCGETNMEER